MDWLGRPLICGGVIVESPLDPSKLTDADLWSICLRMATIMATIEMPRCEGRLMPIRLFDDIDTLESMVVHGHPSRYGHTSPPRLVEWTDLILEFGEYYDLEGHGPIIVDPEIYRDAATRFTKA